MVVHITLPWLELKKTVGDDCLAVGGGQQRVSQADNTTAGNIEVELHTVALGVDSADFALAAGNHIDNLARELLGHKNRQLFDRLAFLTVNLFDDNLRLTNLQLVSFAAHGFDKHGEVHNAATVDEHCIGRTGLLDTHGQVLLQLLEETVAQVAAGNILALFAEEWRVVDGEQHAHRGLVDLDRGQWLGILDIANSIADLECHVFIQIHQHGANLTSLDRGLDTFFAQTFESVKFLYLADNLLAIALHQADVLTRLKGSAMQTADSYTSEIRTVIQRRNHHLSIALVHFRSGDMLDNQVHKVSDILGGGVPILTHPALFGAAIGGGELQLVVVGAEIEHQVEHSLLGQLRVAVRLVDLVDNNNRLQAQLDCFLQHEACLWHGAFESINHQQHTVGHIEHALHLATEIAVARCVDNVDFIAFIAHADILRKDGDAAFAFKVVVVED